MMRASLAVMTVWLICLMPTAAMLTADEPTKKAEAVKPQWQRMLQGDDAKKAAEQEKKLAELQEAARLTEALKVAEALAQLRGKVQGADHWEAVNARSAVEAIRRVWKATKEEQQSYSRTFAVRRDADALVAKGRYRGAQPLLDQVLGIRRKVLGEEHPDTATSYDDQASNLLVQGKYQEATDGLGKALAIRRKVLGEEHPDTATSYDNLASSLFYQGKYQEAEEGYGKASAIRRKVLGEEHSDTAVSYNNVASNLKAQGKYQEAEEGFRRALAIFRKVLGEEHPNTATSLNSLAQNLNAQGKYKEAEDGYRKALAIFRTVLGEEHPHTAQSYNNVAYNLNAQGRYKEAEDGYRKALAIFRTVLGEEHRYTATSYNNVAHNLNAQGKYKEAEDGYRKALAIFRKVLGDEHPHTAQSYDNVAHNLNAQGKYKEAEDDYRKALAIFRKVLGDEHPDTAQSYDNLASNLNAQGKYNEAEEGFRKALAIRRNVLGEEHTNTARSYDHVAYNLNSQGKYKEAENFSLRAADSFAKARLHVAATGLERATKTSENSPLQRLAAVLARNGKPDDAWQRFEESLARGTGDDFSARLRRPQADRDKQAQIIKRIDRLQKLLERASLPPQTPEHNRQREGLLSQLRQAYDELEAFTQQLEKKYGPIAGQVFSRSQIQATLAADAAFIAWIDLASHPKAVDPNGEHWAILLRSTGSAVWVRQPGTGEKNDWTEADVLLPSKLRAGLKAASGDWQQLVARLRKQRLDPLAPHLTGVRRLIVLPSTALDGVPLEAIADQYTISYAHSGTMYTHLRSQRTPSGKGLFALADPVFDSPELADKPPPLPPAGLLLTVVSPGSNAATSGLRLNDVLLRYGDTPLAGPKDFKPQPESDDPHKRVPVVVWRQGKELTPPLSVRPGKLGVVFAQEPAPQAVAEQRRIDQLLASRGDEGKWRRLPGTRIEAASLQRLFGKEQSRLLLDSEASEQRLDELARSGELGKYRYVHLATHGAVDNDFPLRSAVILSRDHLPDDKQRTDLLVSGQSIPDGRLTAEEALERWNLHCDLVTLSACQTALGKYERGEGFVGFAQSLILCGTRSVCLSLWKVDDVATALLMERFYQNLLGKRDGLKRAMTKAAALAEAKTWLRGLPRAEAIQRVAVLSNGLARDLRPKRPPLDERPADKIEPKNAPKPDADRPYAHPYYWAAFVLIGDGE